ncbi:hypothetical protein HPB52_000845 [Rhipicephalus sanguineus]|uniref:Uncharacterized protein n=1 Tax=Rhipicephalus sanguineus TaxID=34632 RepID=A0A9D4PD11_RHISA|nr:hypothetical protein HPB52_000845 [Rhipicephalus sanguineus]
MVLLIIIDTILLYFWLTSTRTKFHKTVTKTVNSARRLLVPGLYLEDGEDSYLLLEEISPKDLILRGWQRRQHMCNTVGCLWLRDYIRSRDSGSSHIQSQMRSPPHPCDDFHEHVCGSRQQSIYEDGVARLMDAVKTRLLAALRETVGNGSEVPKGASERKRAERDAMLLQRCLDGATVITEDDITRACGSIQSVVCPNSVPEGPLRISEDFFQNNPNASVHDYAAFVKRRPELEEAPAKARGEGIVQVIFCRVAIEIMPLGSDVRALPPGEASQTVNPASRSRGPLRAALEGPLLRATHGE